MSKPYDVVNEIQSTLSVAFVHGTDASLTLTSVAGFPTGGGYIRVGAYEADHWVLLEYTGIATNDLTGLTPCTLGVVETEAAWTFPIGTVVEVTNAAEMVKDVRDEAVHNTDFDAQSIIAAVTADTPVKLAVAEQTLVGRITGGNIDDLSAAQAGGILSSVLGTKTTATTTIYVDSGASGANDGTSWTDAYTTIQAAIGALPDLIAHAVTIYVKQGAGSGASAKYYRETVTIKNKVGTTAVAAITIQGHNGTDPQTINADYIRVTGADSGTDPSSDTPARRHVFNIENNALPIYLTALQADCAGADTGSGGARSNIYIGQSRVITQTVNCVYSANVGLRVERYGILEVNEYTVINNNAAQGVRAIDQSIITTYGESGVLAGIEVKDNYASNVNGQNGVTAMIYNWDVGGTSTTSGISLEYASIGRIYGITCALNSTGYCVNLTRTSWARVYGNCTLSNTGAGDTLFPSSGANLVNNADASVLIDNST